tara:strand:- start:171 stop:371 length:201 start_codon:yes stop_codon:yes gene_type:complete
LVTDARKTWRSDKKQLNVHRLIIEQNNTKQNIAKVKTNISSIWVETPPQLHNKSDPIKELKKGTFF